MEAVPMRATRRWVIAALAAAWAGARSNTAASRARAGDSVLVLQPFEHPLVQAIREHLSAGGLGNPPLPPLNVVVQNVPDPTAATSAAQKRAAVDPRLRAVFVLTQRWARAIQQKLPHLPIVFTGVSDPLHRCLVDSHARPGRNATGFMHFLPDFTSKMADFLLLGFPKLQRIVVPFQASGPNFSTCDVLAEADVVPVAACSSSLGPAHPSMENRLPTQHLVAFARHRQIDLLFAAVCRVEDLPPLLAVASRGHRTGVVVPWQDLFDRDRAAFVRSIESVGLAAIYPHRRYLDHGGLMATDFTVLSGRDSAPLLMLVEVLNGVAPAELPIQSPHGLALHIHAGAAVRTGLRPSLAALHRADRIET